PTSFCLIELTPRLLSERKCSGIEAVREASAGLEGNLIRCRLRDFFGLDASDFPQLSLLDESRHLSGIGYCLLDLLEGVLDLLLPLHKPHEPRVAVVPELLNVLQWQEALGEPDLS
ncbi:hypothetical protein EJB05_14032, partial [Eragrostis curvula]